MHEQELEMWWSSLAISQKERIAKKAISKAHPLEKVKEEQYRYPECSRWWLSLDPERQLAIHDHCIDRHGYLLQEWNEADPYGD